MSANQKTKTYTQMSKELDAIIEWFESDKVNLEEAIDKYEEATRLLKLMEEYLNKAENKIKKIEMNFGG